MNKIHCFLIHNGHCESSVALALHYGPGTGIESQDFYTKLQLTYLHTLYIFDNALQVPRLKPTLAIRCIQQLLLHLYFSTNLRHSRSPRTVLKHAHTVPGQTSSLPWLK